MTGPSQPVPAWRQWGRRISLAALLVGIGVMVVRILDSRPVSVTVDYQLGPARVGLRRATMTYLQDDVIVHQVRYGFSAQRPAPAVKRHQLHLQRGDLEVHIELSYEKAPPAGLGGVRRGKTVRLRRPLIVAGESAVTVVVAGDGS